MSDTMNAARVKPSDVALIADSYRLGTTSTANMPIKGSNQRELSSRLSLMARSPVP